MKKLTMLLAVCLLAGCVPSLHELYTAKDVIYDPNLIGTWAESGKAENQTWVFGPGKDPNTFSLVYTDDKGKKAPLIAHLLKIKGQRFLDFYPEDPNCNLAGFYWAHFVPAHTFFKVEQISPTLKMATMDPDKLKSKLDEDPNLIKHEFVDNRVLLTAPTEDLQKFVSKYAGQEWLYGKAQELLRINPSASEPNKPKKEPKPSYTR